MIGRLYIDQRDVYTEYGVYVTKGGWNELVALPPLKAVESNDWQEEDGIEPDLSTPVLDTREVQIKFAVAGLYSRLPALIDLLSDGAYHLFNCAYIGKLYILRLVSEGARTTSPTLDLANLKFADDIPEGINNVYEEPQSDLEADETYTLDGKKFTDYGVRIVKGALAEIKKKPAVKLNLLRNIKTQEGAVYDYERVTYKSKDVNLTCVMTASTLAQLWKNYYALLVDMTRPYEHVFRSSETATLFYCYYKKCSVSEFYPEGKIWLKFTITMNFVCRVPSTDIEEAFGISEITDTSTDAATRRERISLAISEDELPIYLGSSADIDDAFALASEEDDIVLTQDGESFVSLKPVIT